MSTLFPRTTIEHVSVSRLMVGINWFLGWSHTSKAKDDFIRQFQTRQRLAGILTVFMKAGIDTVYGAREPIDISLSIIERRAIDVPLQRTRSKESVEEKRGARVHPSVGYQPI